MSNLIKTVWYDIKNRNNLELYLVLVVALLVLVVDAFGVDTEAAIIEVVLAVLALLAFGLIQDRHANARMERKVDDLAARELARQFFTEWSDDAFRQRLETAREVSLLGIAHFVFLSQNTGPFTQFLKRGGVLRCILVEPKSKAMTMAKNLAEGYEREAEHLASQVDLSLNLLRDFVQSATAAENVEVKLTDHLPHAVMTMLDHESEDGVMYVTLQGFEVSTSSLPSFTLRKREDERQFTFYQQSFENLWAWPDSKAIHLASKS